MTTTASLSVTASPRVRYDLAFWGLAAVIAAAMIFVHGRAGMTLPAPWGDEAYFVWQARAFERWTHFIAPELDPTRPVLLLPFTYQALLGLTFKVFGYSIELARGLSLVAVLVGFACLALVARRLSAPIAALMLIGAFMLNGHFVVMANNARMEGVLFAVLCAALLMMQRGRAWTALALLTISPMIHPNGLLCLAPVAVYAFVAVRVHTTRPPRDAWLLFGVAALLWLANGLYALSYPAGFMHDIAYRIGETRTANKGFEQLGGWHAIGLVLIALVAVIGARRKAGIGHLLAFAVGGWLMYRLRTEQWYEVIGDFTYLLLSLAVLELGVLMAGSPQRLAGLLPKWALATMFTLCLLVFHLKTDRVKGPFRYFEDLTVDGFRFASEDAYFTADDRRALETFLHEQAQTGVRVVEYYPWGDTLLLARDVERDGMRFQIPYFDPLFAAGRDWPWGYRALPAPQADLFVIRASSYQPRNLDERLARVIARAEERSGGSDLATIRTRDGETWYAVRAAAP